MRHLLVISVSALMIAASAIGVRADNQTSADRIAVRLGEQFPNDEITVQFQDGKVWLRGQMGSDADIQKLILFVSELDGVASIENEMNVASTFGTISPVSANMPRLIRESDREIPMVVPADQAVRVPAPIQQARIPAKRQVVASQPKAAPTPFASNEQPVIAQVANRQLVRAPQETIISSRVISVQPVQSVPAQAPRTSIRPVAHQHFGNGNTVPMNAMVEAHGPQDFVVEQGAVAQHATPGAGYAAGCRPNLPPYAWPSYAAHPNYAQVTYPKKYSAGCWPNIGPFYPYPEPPLGWRKVTMEWHDGNWWLDFDDGSAKGPFSPLFRDPIRHR